MNWKKRLSKESIIYVVIDAGVLGASLERVIRCARSVARSSADIVQIRFSEGTDRENMTLCRQVRQIMRRYRKCCIVNNRVDLALLCDADGVHLGAGDIEVSDARRILGPRKIIGKTTHSLAEFTRFKQEKVDYLSFGPLFDTPLKPRLKGRLGQSAAIMAEADLPVVMIGGITRDTLPQLVKRGIKRVAACRDIITASDPARRIDDYRRVLS